MGVNMRCPKCGSDRVQLSNEMNKHGCLWFLLCGIYYVAWYLCRMLIGLIIFIVYDSWANFVYRLRGRGYVWQSKRWFSNRRRIYYCHTCGYNFRA